MKPSSNDTPAELSDRVSAELQAAAQAIPAVGDPSRAVARAEQRSQRRTMAGVAAGIVAVGGLSLGALALRPESSTAVVAAAGDDGNASTSGEQQPLTLEWRATKADVDWPEASFVGADGYRYALSTAPGTRYGDVDEYGRVPQAVYRTADGENWESVAVGDTPLNGLGARDGVLYSVSTAAAADGSIVSSVVSSVDRGGEWTGVELPFEFEPVDDPNGLLYAEPGQPVSLVVGDSALIATASRTRWFDDAKLTQFLGLPGDMVSSLIEPGADGTRVVLRDYGPCNEAWAAIEAQGDPVEYPGDPTECSNPPVVADVSPAELGITGSLLQQRSAISTDGITWSPVEVPGSQVWFAGGVFIAADTHPLEGLSYSRSTDGLTWSPIESGPYEGLDIVGASNGVLVARAYHSLSSLNVVTLSFDGGATWNDLDPTDLAADAGPDLFVSTVAAGDLGIVAVVGSGDADPADLGNWRIVTSADGVNWTSQEVVGIDGIDAGYPGWAFVDADRIGIVFSGAERSDDGTISAVTLLGTPTR